MLSSDETEFRFLGHSTILLIIVAQLVFELINGTKLLQKKRAIIKFKQTSQIKKDSTEHK